MSLDVAGILAGLDDDQSLICVQTADCTALVNAGAGSGKTRLIIAQIAYEIATGKMQPEEMVVITFTNKAARELKERLYTMIGRELTDRIEYVGTFHAVCVKLLRQFGRQDLGWGHFHILDEDDQNRMLRRAAKLLNMAPRETDIATARRLISLWKNRMLPPQAVRDAALEENDYIKAQIAELYAKYMEVCRQVRGMDFDDLLLYTVWALRKDGAMKAFCHERFRRIWVDEYQDTNHVQSEMIRLMRGPNCHIMAIGKWSLPM